MWFPCNPVLRRAGSRRHPRSRVRPTSTPWSATARPWSCSAPTSTAAQRADRVPGSKTITSSSTCCHGPTTSADCRTRACDGMRHTVMKPLAAQRLGELRGPGARTAGLRTARRRRARSYLIGGRALIGRLLSAITAYPHASLHTNTPLVESGHLRRGRRRCRRRGATADARAIRARAGVLLAAGGFENNPALRAALRRARRRQGHHGRAGQHGAGPAGRHGRRRRHRPDGSGVVVAGVHPSRRALGVLAVVHRRDLRRSGR